LGDERDVLGLLNRHIDEARGLVALVGDHLEVARSDWLLDAVGALELDPATAVAGGLIRDTSSRILHLGYVGGLGGFFGSPLYGKPWRSVVHPLPIRRNVSAVYGSFIVARPRAISEAGGLTGIDGSTGYYGIDLSLRLARAGHAIGWTPRMDSRTAVEIRNPKFEDTELCRSLLARGGRLILDDPFYNRKLSLHPARYGDLAMPLEREKILAELGINF
jgi:hypothetical protein